MGLTRHGAALLLATLAVPSGRAECMGQHLGLDGQYERMLLMEPAQAVRQLEASLMSLGPAAAGKSAERAHQLIMLADGYDALGRHSDATGAIARGLASVTAQTDPRIALRLRLRDTGMREDTATAAQVLANFEEVAHTVPRDSPLYFCMLVDRGYLRYRAEQMGPAISDLTTAIAMARANAAEQDRIDAGGVLSLVYQSLGFFDESLALANESVAYYESHHEPIGLADALYRRGRARTSMGDFVSAEPDLRRAFAEAIAASDLTDAFFARITLCDLLVSSARVIEAQPVCEDAAARARAIDDREGQTRALIMQGEARLQRGNAAAAVALIDSALAGGGGLLRRPFISRALQTRADAHAMLGDFKEAHEDLQRSFDVAREVGAARAAQQVDLLRVRFEISRKDGELQLARQQAELLAAHADRDRVLRNFIVAIAAIALLSGWLLTRALQRRRIADAARQIAEAQLESLGRLAAGVAHDFNNLLTVVQQASGLLARMPAVASDAEAASLVRATREAAATGGSITTQLLSFGRQQNLRPETLLVGEFFAAQQALWRNVLGPQAQIGRAHV